MPSVPTLAPWLQIQLQHLLAQRGHAWLLSGPSGLGQFDLALALARAWLCEQATEQGACGDCPSCHAIQVHAHADLCVLIPETLSLSLGWPLDEKSQEELDAKKRKPSKEIKVDAARQAISFSQLTRSRGNTKIILVFPAERMNSITANSLLKTLEEPPGAVKFILATEAAHQLLPTIRSRCQNHTMLWPDFENALTWLNHQINQISNINLATQKSSPTSSSASDASAFLTDLQTLLVGAGGRPNDTLNWITQSTSPSEAAQHWQALPKAIAKGEVNVLATWTPAQAVDALQKICHDVWACYLGAQPRFFKTQNLPLPLLTNNPSQSILKAKLEALTNWSQELKTIARTIEHPYHSGLLIESLVSHAKIALEK